MPPTTHNNPPCCTKQQTQGAVLHDIRYVIECMHVQRSQPHTRPSHGKNLPRKCLRTRRPAARGFEGERVLLPDMGLFITTTPFHLCAVDVESGLVGLISLIVPAQPTYGTEKLRRPTPILTCTPAQRSRVMDAPQKTKTSERRERRRVGNRTPLHNGEELCFEGKANRKNYKQRACGRLT